MVGWRLGLVGCYEWLVVHVVLLVLYAAWSVCEYGMARVWYDMVVVWCGYAVAWVWYDVGVGVVWLGMVCGRW